MFGKIARMWSACPFAVLIAILVVQLAYWLVVNPALFLPNPTPDKLAVQHVLAARLESPDLAAAAHASFKPVELPWDDCCMPGYRAVQMEFSLPKVPTEGLGIVPRIGSDNYRMYVNGSLLFGDGEMTLPAISYHGNVRATFRIPAPMLKPGVNRLMFILVRDAGAPYFSVAPPAIGGFDSIKRAYSHLQYSLNSFLTLSQGIGLAAALLAFILWLRSDRNPAIFWMALLCGAWALRIVHHRATYPPVHGELRIILLYVCVNMVPVALLNFANYWTGFPNRWVTRISVAGYAASIAIVALIVGLGLFQKIDTADRVSMGFGLTEAIATIGIFVLHYLKRTEKRHWEVAIFVLCATLIGHDSFASLFDGDYGDHVKRALPVVLVGFIAPFFAGNVRLFRSMGEFNLLLQGQLAERTAELELAHRRETAVVRAAAHLNERKRIMRDMHDGLGSQLMSMLLMARRGEARPEVVAEGLQSVIDEMRLMIDSMDSVGESLSSALLIFRDRLRSRVEEAGFRLEWSDTTDGALPDYGPRDVLQVFRIMQEAVANALRHSGGSHIRIRLSPGSATDTGMTVEIVDDGKGLCPTGDIRSPRGRGLGNMAMRAQAIGGHLRVLSDNGVRVVLDLPTNGQDERRPG